MLSIREKQSGFTMVELTISALVAAIVSTTLLTVTIVFYGNIVRSDIRSRQVVDSQIILRNITDELRLAASVLVSNDITDTNEPTGGWQTSNSSAILIVSIPAIDTTGNFIYDASAGEYFQNEIIYFNDGETMFRRILANPSAPGNVASTTCPESSPGDCSTLDRIITENYQSMDFVFYDQDNAEITDATLARSVTVNINLSRSAYGESVNTSNRVRATLRN